MTAGGRTAYRGADPNCPVCLGTGTDLVFESECGECWDTSQEDLNDTRMLLAQRFVRSEQQEEWEAASRAQYFHPKERWYRRIPKPPRWAVLGAVAAYIGTLVLIVGGAFLVHPHLDIPDTPAEPPREWNVGRHAP